MTTTQKVIQALAIAFAIFIIVSIASGILTAIYGCAHVLGLNKKDTQTVISESDESIVTNFENTNAATLQLDLKYTNLVIKTGETLKAETNSSNIECRQDNNNLVIKEKNHNWFNNNEKNNLIVYIPEGLTFETVKIEAGAGKIEIQELNAKNLYFEMGAGKVEIQNLNIQSEAKINGGAGKVTILNGEINNLNLDMGIGKFELTSKLLGDNKIEAGIGKLDITLKDSKENYTIKASKGIGSINIDGKEMSDNEEYGSGENYIKIEGGIGSTQVKFE